MNSSSKNINVSCCWFIYITREENAYLAFVSPGAHLIFIFCFAWLKPKKNASASQGTLVVLDAQPSGLRDSPVALWKGEGLCSFTYVDGNWILENPCCVCLWVLLCHAGLCCFSELCFRPIGASGSMSL